MTLGTGIFLSAVVIAVVLLYGITKDRWRWRLLLKRTAYIFGGLMLLGGLGISGAILYQQIPTPITKQNEYAGIRLGMSQDEVLYTLGAPTSVITEAEANDPGWKGDPLIVDVDKIDKSRSVRDYRRWLYSKEQSYLNVDFNDTRTAVTSIMCFSSDKLSRCSSISGITDGDSESEVLRVIGDTPVTKIDGVTKTLIYPDLGIQLKLTKGTVY